jgi:hypothetical protein
MYPSLLTIDKDPNEELNEEDIKRNLEQLDQ